MAEADVCTESKGIDDDSGGVGRGRRAQGLSNVDGGVDRGRGIDDAYERSEIMTESVGDRQWS